MIDNSGLIQPQFLEIENPLIEGSFNEFYREDKSFYIIILYSNQVFYLFSNRRNFPFQLRELRNARREAFFLNTVFFLCSLGKVTLVILLFMKTEEKCFGPLLLWLILMFIHDLLNCFTLMRLNYEIIILVPTTFLNQMNDPLNPDDSYQNIDITLHSYVRQQIHSSRLTGFDINQNLEKTDKCLSIFIELCRLFYFVLFVYGNVVFFSDNICTKGTFFIIIINFRVIERKIKFNRSNTLFLGSIFDIFGYGISLFSCSFDNIFFVLLLFTIYFNFLFMY